MPKYEVFSIMLFTSSLVINKCLTNTNLILMTIHVSLIRFGWSSDVGLGSWIVLLLSLRFDYPLRQFRWTSLTFFKIR